MKLTNYIRDAFVRAAMLDVPNVDYDSLIRKLVHDDAVAALPPAVKKIYLDPNLRHFVRTTYDRYYEVQVSYPHFSDDTRLLTDKVKPKVSQLADLDKVQRELRRELQVKLRNVAYSVTTRKALALLLPEFEKYLPVDDVAAVKTLPVIANVVAEFTKAGWPKKGGKK